MTTVKKNQQLFLIFLVLSLVTRVFSLVGPYLKPKNVLFTGTIIHVLSSLFFALSAVFVYKIYQWVNSPKAPALGMAVIYFISNLISPVFSIIILVAIIWQARSLKLPEDGNEIYFKHFLQILGGLAVGDIVLTVLLISLVLRCFK
jgi:hypothetical protein